MKYMFIFLQEGTIESFLNLVQKCSIWKQNKKSKIIVLNPTSLPQSQKWYVSVLILLILVFLFISYHILFMVLNIWVE